MVAIAIGDKTRVKQFMPHDFWKAVQYAEKRLETHEYAALVVAFRQMSLHDQVVIARQVVRLCNGITRIGPLQALEVLHALKPVLTPMPERVWHE